MRNGVYALMCLYDLPSGNSIGRDLYELFELYLRNNGAKEQINRVVKQFEAQAVRLKNGTAQIVKFDRPIFERAIHGVIRWLDQHL